jgi:hypothetical protein
MRGFVGDENVSLQVGGSTVQSWVLSTVMSDYPASTTLGGEIRVAFTNDNGARDVQVDYISVNGEIRQAEDQADNTGAWDGECGAGSYTEMLHCNGSIGFGVVAPPEGSGPYESIDVAPDGNDSNTPEPSLNR